MTKGNVKIVFVLCLFLASTALISIDAAPIQSLRSGGYFCGTDGTCMWEKPGDPDWLFERFTYAMGYADCPHSIDDWRTKSPGSILTLYTSGTDLPPYKLYTSNSYNSGKKSTWIRDRMVELGEIEEHAYMHFYNDTRIRQYISGSWDTLLIPGTYSMTIDAGDSASRVPNSYVSALFVSGNTYTYPTRLSPNFANPDMRQAYKEYITQIFNEVGQNEHWPGKSGHWDGVYFDNYSPWAMMGSHLVSGGLIVETGASPGELLAFATDEYRDWGWEWMKQFGREVRDTLQVADQWAMDGKKKALCYNIGISHRADYLDPEVSGADALNVEFGFDPVYSNNASTYRLENLHTRDSIAVSNGVTYFWTSPPRTSYGNGNTTKRLAIYNTLCFYYTARTDSTWIFMRPQPGNAYGVFYNPGFDTLAWIPAMAYDIGNPTAHYQLHESGSSPDQSGAYYKIWVRDYQYGKVFMRARDGFDAKWGATSTPITVNLGGSYRQLLTDGTLGPSVTAIELVGAAGAIMIPVGSGECLTPPTIPVLAAPSNGSTASSGTPSLCSNNSTQTDCSQPIRYHFQVSTVSNFTTIAAENSSVSEGVSQTCWQVPSPLNAGETHYWRVRATNGVSQSTWSTVWSFEVPNSVPSTPVPSSPATGATVSTRQPSLVVQNSSDPDGQTLTYHFQVSTSSGFGTIVAEDVSVNEGAGSTSWQVNNQLANHVTHYWRVRAFDGVAHSNWSTTRSFYVNQTSANTAPTAPTVNSPAYAAVITDITPLLVVNNSDDVDGDPLTYQFELYDSTSSTLLSQSGMISAGSSTTSWQVPITLNNNTKYWWRVRAYDSQDWSLWMSSSYFTTSSAQNHPPTIPVPFSPLAGDTILGSIHVLVVNNSTDPDGDLLTYDFVVSSDSLMTKLIDVGTYILQGWPYTIYYTSATYQDGLPYYWRSRANDGQMWTNWCTPQRFVHMDIVLDAEDAPMIVAPVDGAEVMNSQPSLRVSLARFADSTLVLFELYDSFNLVEPLTFGAALIESGYAQWVVDTPLENSQTYYWRARSVSGGYGDMASFTIGAPIFASPSPFSYLDGELVVHNIPERSRLEVYTVSGDRVITIDNLSGDFHWDVHNSNGEKLASGVYLYYVITGDEKFSDKFIVVR